MAGGGARAAVVVCGAALAAVVALAGCSPGGGPAAAASPAASPSTAASSAPTASASAQASCRLPVASADAPTDGNPAHGQAGHGGFLQLPGGAFTADPQSLATYDLVVRRWLPVPRAWVSPDGTRYAWPEYASGPGPTTGTIHVVDVATGADRPVTVPSPSMPVSFETAGIYITRVVPNSDAPAQGLSLVDPGTGALKQISATGSWRVIGGGTAFGVDLDSGAAPPAQQGPGAGNRLRALDLATGAARNVQTFAGASVNVLGIDGADPVLLVQTADRAQVRVGSATLYDQPVGEAPPGSPVIVDGSTVWFSGAGGVWRSTGGAPLAKISAPVQLALVAGACR